MSKAMALEIKTAADPLRAPETKVTGPETGRTPGDGEGVGAALDDLMQAFEEFKQTNNTRLTQLETRTRDVVTEDKLTRIGATLDELMLKARRPGLSEGTHPGGGRFTPTQAIEHRAAFEGYMRSGREDNLRRLEAKALSVGSDPDGGYLVPDETERMVLSRLAEISPIRAIAGNRQVSGSVFKKPYAISGPAVGWVGETDARPQTASPTLAELTFPAMELYAMPAATATLLEDAAVNVDEWIAAEVETAFAEQEGAAFVSGDGVNKPRGFLDYDTVDESAWVWGKLGTVPTGVAGAFPASDASDVLVDLIYALKSGHRQNAHWVMNRRTQAEIRKLKDADGNYLWQPPAAAGGQASLMNFAITEAEDMPDISADATPVAFGDFRRGYLVVDRLGVRVLRDPYSAKPYVLFYTTKRVGGGVQDFDAIKLLKFAAS
ncbi:phage major capsid protein [Breoghania sp. L-A4]|uniref:phage major capsid protein n=1 Tax=Breoghania sp. L-A4 TaxID=2304600 RepID=UPI000E35E093|nr:phage major capsid protein [Breoghania sp. L-A4]AXS39960.1 phage major capsid protein [Breoghania sp. L-A4]